MSPDPYKASAGPNDPGSWNRYAYVQGDPVNHTDRSGLNRDAEDCIDDPDACEAEDWGGLGGSGPLNPGGSTPTLPGKVVNEENQLDGLQQAGIISGWGITPSGFDLALTPGEAAEIGTLCVAEPWACVAVAGGLTIYVTYTYGSALVQALQNAYQASRIKKWSLTCHIHLIGTQNHQSDRRLKTTLLAATYEDSEAQARGACNALGREAFGPSGGMPGRS
jgi:hypothetical protein